MARSANSENLKRDEQGPDYAATVALVRGKLRSNDADQKSLAQDNATIWTRIEKQLGVHKGAAKTFQQIDKMAPEKRTDYLRSLFGLLGVAGYDHFDDLVDRMQTKGGKGTAKPEGKSTSAPKAKAPDAVDAVLVPFQRVNLKSGWIQRTKADLDLADKGVNDLTDDDWEDVREATPEELATEREGRADFDDDAGNVHPFPGAKSK